MQPCNQIIELLQALFFTVGLCYKGLIDEFFTDESDRFVIRVRIILTRRMEVKLLIFDKVKIAKLTSEKFFICLKYIYIIFYYCTRKVNHKPNTL